MDNAAYVLSGWIVTGVTISAYALWLSRRTRRTLDRLPPEERPPWA